jgi:hypothetical protein
MIALLEAKGKHKSLDLASFIRKLPAEDRFGVACKFISHVDDDYYRNGPGYGSQLIIDALPEEHRCEYAIKIMDKIEGGFQCIFDLIPENDHPKFTAKIIENLLQLFGRNDGLAEVPNPKFLLQLKTKVLDCYYYKEIRNSIQISGLMRKLPIDSKCRFDIACELISYVDDDYYGSADAYGSGVIIRELPENYRLEYAIKIKDKIQGGVSRVLQLLPEKDRVSFHKEILSSKTAPVPLFGLFTEAVDETKKEPAVAVGDGNQYVH